MSGEQTLIKADEAYATPEIPPNRIIAKSIIPEIDESFCQKNKMFQDKYMEKILDLGDIFRQRIWYQ